MEEARDYIIKNKTGYVDPNDPSYSILIPEDIYKKTHRVKPLWYGIEVAAICSVVVVGLLLYVVLCCDRVYREVGKKMNQLLFILPFGGFWVVFIWAYLLAMR